MTINDPPISNRDLYLEYHVEVVYVMESYMQIFSQELEIKETTEYHRSAWYLYIFLSFNTEKEGISNNTRLQYPQQNPKTHSVKTQNKHPQRRKRDKEKTTHKPTRPMGNRCRLRTAICQAVSRRYGYPDYVRKILPLFRSPRGLVV